jgi:hypothetical protein
MILRALFWITLIVILMPHEPDLGLGRPGFPQRLAGSEAGTMHCPAGGACAGALGLLDRFQALAVRNLAEVKADIERDDKRRSSAD